MIYIVYKIDCNTKKRTDILSTTIKEKAYKTKEDLENKSKLLKAYDIAFSKAEKEWLDNNPMPIYSGLPGSSGYNLYTKIYNKWFNQRNNFLDGKRNELSNGLSFDDLCHVDDFTYGVEERKQLL